MIILENETMSGTTTDRSKITFMVHGRWAARDIIRSVAHIITEQKTGRIDGAVMLDMLTQAEESVIRIHGPKVAIPKAEPEIHKANQHSELRAKKIWQKFMKVFWVGALAGWLTCGLFIFLVSEALRMMA